MLSRLRYPQKFLLISLLFLLPLAVSITFMVDEQNVRIRFAEKEIVGARYLRALNEVYTGALLHRHQALRALTFGITVDERLVPARNMVDAGLAAVRTLDAAYGASLHSTERLVAIDTAWAELRADPLRGEVLDGYDRYQRLIDDLRDLIAVVGDQSNLILDPDLDTYYMMDAVLLRLPEAQELIARVLLLNEGLIPPERQLADRRTELIMTISLLRANSNTLHLNLAKAYANTRSAELRPAVGPVEGAYRMLMDEALADFQSTVAAPDRLLGTSELVESGQRVFEGSGRVYGAASPLLERLLSARIDALQRRQTLTLLFALLLVCAALLAGLQLVRSISRPLVELHQATVRLTAGDHNVRVAVSGTSEVAEVGHAFNAMADEVQAGREQLEQRVVERTRALAAATREAQEARTAAEAASRAKSAFLANMSHELRTPLNAIIGYSEMLQEEAAEQGYDEISPDLEKIRTAGKHLLALINDILDLSKIEAGRMELYPERISLAHLIHEVVTTIRPAVEKNGNLLEVRGELGGALFTDLTKLRQSLLNLLSNAAKFTEHGRITVSVSRQMIDQTEYARLAVSDTGIGMTQDQLARIFREFTQGDSSTTRRYGGTGLGLALSRRFCQMMGGDITVTSVLGEGSTFTIVVPCELTVPAPQEPLPLAIAAAEDAVPNRTPRGTVLVIDDDPATQELLRRTLVREGMRVVVAGTGEEGLAQARALRPDVITLDVLLRGADGWQILAAIKADEELASIPVLMLTIMDERNTGFALGAADYLTKPIDRRRLVELVNRFCPRDLASVGDVLVIEDDAVTRDILCRTMEQAGWATRAAEHGRAGLRCLSEGRPGLILLDLMMPELDGFGFLGELRQNPAWVDIPVIVVTAMDLSVEERAQLTSSVQRVLQKGLYERETLLGEVRRAIAMHTAAAA